MRKKDENIQQKQEIIYPQFLSTAPHGTDLFDGKSQERVMHAIEQYVLRADNPNLIVSEREQPRIIGLEGSWGSGKSNVIKMLEGESALKDNYIFFTYDAWGNQEDLQRKAILYMLTKDLIDKELLVKNTKMRQYDPLVDKVPEDKECTWNERLDSLSSTTSFTKETSVPSIQKSTKWFGLVIVIMGLLIGLLQIDSMFAWWVNILISIFPMAAYLLILKFKSKDGFKAGWNRMFAMYESGATTDTTSYVISKEDPTSTEFKDWIRGLSNSLAEGKKLVVVFDNMDRLSQEKVRTLWSSIYTFFADTKVDYKNVWCIIPYDAEHLTNAFDGDSLEQKTELLKRFLQKTFPVIYQVPEPIVTDYKDVVNKLMRRAFDTKLHPQEYDLINRCYRLKHEIPNVREIIAFINELVRIYHIWHDEIDVVSMAAYVLMKNEIDNTPTKDEKAKSSEEYIIDKEYEKIYGGALKSRDSETMQRNIAALHYGVKPNKAYTIMLKRVLHGILESETRDENALIPYLENVEHMSVLDDVFNKLDPSKYANVVQYFVFAETKPISQEAKDLLLKFWEHIATDFMHSNEPLTSLPDYMRHVLKYVSEGTQGICVTHFINRLYKAKAIKGDNLYNQINDIFEQPYAKDWSIEYVCPQQSLEPDIYMQYVRAAQKNFNKYPITTDVTKLNEFLQSLLVDDFPYVEEVQWIKDTYDLTPFAEKTKEVLKAGKSEAKLVGQLLQILRVYNQKFPIDNLPTQYMQQLWSNVAGTPDEECFPEIYALKAFKNIGEELPSGEKDIKVLEDRMFFYTDTTSLLKGLMTHQRQYVIKLVKSIIVNKHHDSNPQNTEWEWVKEWQTIVNLCQVQRSDILAFASDWGYQLSEKEQNAPIERLLAQADWIDTLLEAPISPLADSLLKKFAQGIQGRAITDFIPAGNITHTGSYWDVAFARLIDTNYIPNTENGKLKELVLYIIRYAAQNRKVEDPVWRKVLSKCRFSAISSEIRDLRNDILINRGGYAISPNNFALLHTYLEQAEINTVSHKSDAANCVLAKVIEDDTCQKIILEKGEYYRPLIADTAESASELHAKIKAIEIANPESDFSKYLLEMVNYLPNPISEAETEK